MTTGLTRWGSLHTNANPRGYNGAKMATITRVSPSLEYRIVCRGAKYDLCSFSTKWTAGLLRSKKHVSFFSVLQCTSNSEIKSIILCASIQLLWIHFPYKVWNILLWGIHLDPIWSTLHCFISQNCEEFCIQHWHQIIRFCKIRALHSYIFSRILKSLKWHLY